MNPEPRIDFPEESISRARELAQLYKRRDKSKFQSAAQLYEGHFLEIGYGFNEAIKAGNCGRYLHEIVKEADCFTKAGVLYLVAREAGLKPELFYAENMKNVGEGRDSRYVAGSSHAFITVEVKKGERQLIDPQMKGFGIVTIDPDKHEMKIYNKGCGEIKHRHYTQLRLISEEEYLKDIEEKRKPGGGRVALSATQCVHGAGNTRVYLTFNPEEQTLRSSIRRHQILIAEEPYERLNVIDLSTKVGPNGEFDFDQGMLSFFQATAAEWTHYNNPQAPIFFSVQNMRKE